MSGKRPDVAQRLREALRDGGTDRKKRYLELTLSKSGQCAIPGMGMLLLTLSATIFQSPFGMRRHTVM